MSSGKVGSDDMYDNTLAMVKKDEWYRSAFEPELADHPPHPRVCINEHFHVYPFLTSIQKLKNLIELIYLEFQIRQRYPISTFISFEN